MHVMQRELFVSILCVDIVDVCGSAGYPREISRQGPPHIKVGPRFTV